MVSDVMKKIWGLSLSLTSIWGSDTDYQIIEKFKPFWKRVKKGRLDLTKEILQGVPESDGNFFKRHSDEKVYSFLRETFNISDKSSLENCVAYLLNGSNLKRSFEEKRRLFVSIPQKERKSFINSLSQNPKEYAQYSIINQYGKYLPSAGITAHDISNCVSVCRLGLYAGYLDEDKFMEYLDPLTKIAQVSYCSFEEFGLASTVGVLYFLEGYNENVYNEYLENLTVALTHPESPWNNLDWNMDFSE